MSNSSLIAKLSREKKLVLERISLFKGELRSLDASRQGKRQALRQEIRQQKFKLKNLNKSLEHYDNSAIDSEASSGS